MFGSGAGGQRLMIDSYATLHEKGPNRVPPTFIANALVDSTSGMIAIETGAIGHNICIVSACATGTHNVAEAAEAIRRGDCIAVISGSTEAPLIEVAHAGLRRTCAASDRPAPARASRPCPDPFDLTRDGFVLGEGAGGCSSRTSSWPRRAARRSTPRSSGYGSAADGWDMIQPIEGGVGSARAMKMALDRRGVPADEVDLINPHGTSTPVGDAREAEAIWAVFGDRSAAARRSLAISATKSMTGHMMGAAGAFEAFATVMSVAEQSHPRHAQLPRGGPELRPVGRRRDDRGADPLCPLEQHRARWPQRGGHLQALRRRLSAGPLTDAVADGRSGAVQSTSHQTPAEVSPVPSQDPSRRAVVTGLGAIMPIGNDFRHVTGRTSSRASPGRGPITTFDTTGFDVRIAAEVKDFDPTLTMDRKMARRMSRFIHFGVAAATEAIAESGIDFAAMVAGAARPRRVVINTGGGGMEQVVDGARVLWDRGSPARSARSRSRPSRAAWPPRRFR